jgi:hypothetical protein
MRWIKKRLRAWLVPELPNDPTHTYPGCALRAMAREEAIDFYRWAVAHGGIEVPLRSDQTPTNGFERWSFNAENASRLLAGRGEHDSSR